MINKSKPQICLLNETHVTKKCDNSDLKINNYNFVNGFSYSKHTEDIRFRNLSIAEEQCAWYLSLELNVNKMSYIFACVYLSSSSEHKLIVLNSFEQCVDKLVEDKSQ